jgi:hypothetical protein
MILNRDNYPQLHDDGSIEYTNKPRILKFNKYEGKDYWYIEVLYTHRAAINGKSIVHQFEDHIPTDVLEKIRADINTYLIVCSVEPIVEIVENLYGFIIRNQIPEHKVILFNELIDIDQEITRVSSKFNLQKIKAHWISTDECWMFHELGRNMSMFDTYKPLEKKKYDRTFLNFNRRWRIHRPLFVSLLHCHGLLNKGFVSLGDTGEGLDGWESNFIKMLEIVDTSTKEILLKHQHEIINLRKLHVDTNDLTVNLIRLNDSPDTNLFYENSYFSVVSETCFFDGVGRFFSEKTFKPIVYQHPFILLAPARSLEFLKKLGYQTFHPFIDETYDTIEDDMDRMNAVLQETARLAKLSDEELHNFIDQVKPITTYNHHVFRNKRLSEFVVDIT